MVTKRKVHTMSKTTEGNASDQVKSGPEEVRIAFEKSLENAQALSTDFAQKSLAMMREGTEVGLGQFKALTSAKSVSELIEAQSSFLRKQIDFATRQAKEFQSLSEKAMNEFAQPMRDVFSATFKFH